MVNRFLQFGCKKLNISTMYVIFTDEFMYNTVPDDVIANPDVTVQTLSNQHREIQFLEYVDLLMLASYSPDIAYIEHLVSISSARCGHLILLLGEVPRNKNFIAMETELNKQYNNLTIFSELVPNYKTKIQTYVTWTMSSRALYKDHGALKTSIANLSNNSNKTKMFDCLLGSKRRHRDTVQAMYSRSAYQDKIIFSYYQRNLKDGIWDIDVTNVCDSANEVVVDGYSVILSTVLPYKIYNQSYYTIVAETLFNNDFSFYTEKTIKPIIAQRPFIMFAGSNYLKNLRSLGFQTFDGIIDETYDSVDKHEERFALAWKEVEKLCVADPHKIYAQCKDILEHNKNHFFNTNWKHKLHKEIYKHTS